MMTSIVDVLPPELVNHICTFLDEPSSCLFKLSLDCKGNQFERLRRDFERVSEWIPSYDGWAPIWGWHIDSINYCDPVQCERKKQQLWEDRNWMIRTSLTGHEYHHFTLGSNGVLVEPPFTEDLNLPVVKRVRTE